jgi:nitrate reductase NapAB chaperone NapD
MDSEASEQADIAAKQKQKIVIVIIVKDGNKELITECLESLKKECAQHHVERCASFDDAFDYIKQLDTSSTVILIVAGRSHESLKNDLLHMGSLPRAVRNCFIYSTENENTEKPTTSLMHYIFGKRQLLSTIHDVLDALDASPVYGHSDQYTSVTVHESTFNELFRAMKSIQFKSLGFTIKISQMEAVLSPSLFQFKALAEVSGMMNMLPQLKQTVHGECELTLDENTGKLLLNIKKLMIELPKLFGFGGGFADVGSYIPPIPLKGFINFTHPFDLPHMCETRRLMIIPRNQKFIVEEKRATFSVQIDYAEAPDDKK